MSLNGIDFFFFFFGSFFFLMNVQSVDAGMQLMYVAFSCMAVARVHRLKVPYSRVQIWT